MLRSCFLGAALLSVFSLHGDVFVEEDSGVSLHLPAHCFLARRSVESRRDYTAYSFEKTLPPRLGYFWLEVESLGRPISLEEYAQEYLDTVLPEQGREYFYSVDSIEPVTINNIPMLKLIYTRMERVNPFHKILNIKYLFMSDHYACAISASYPPDLIKEHQENLLIQAINGVTLVP